MVKGVLSICFDPCIETYSWTIAARWPKRNTCQHVETTAWLCRGKGFPWAWYSKWQTAAQAFLYLFSWIAKAWARLGSMRTIGKLSNVVSAWNKIDGLQACLGLLHHWGPGQCSCPTLPIPQPSHRQLQDRAKTWLLVRRPAVELGSQQSGSFWS